MHLKICLLIEQISEGWVWRIMMAFMLRLRKRQKKKDLNGKDNRKMSWDSIKIGK